MSHVQLSFNYRLEAGTAHRNSSLYQCCSGFCIDLLQQLAEHLGFTYELVRVEDGRWGTLHHGKWNGLIAELVNKKTDMVRLDIKTTSLGTKHMSLQLIIFRKKIILFKI